MQSSLRRHDGRTLISEGGRAHRKPRREEGPETGVRLSPDESKHTNIHIDPVCGACVLRKNAILSINCFLFIDFDILERQEDNLERQKDNSERRDDNGKDYGHRERPTVVLCLQLMLLYNM